MRLDYPATTRNRDPILEILRTVLPEGARVLEIASGSGQHALYFSEHLSVSWQPSSPDPEERASIAAWRTDGSNALLPPIALDVRDAWPVTDVDAVVCINMIHIAPWECTGALFAGAATCLAPGDPLLLYGPFKQEGRHTAPSNAAFDARLRARDPRWGVRDLSEVTGRAQQHGFSRVAVHAMPANNLTVVFQRTTTAPSPTP